MSAAASYRIGWGMASHRARHVYPDGTVLTLCGKRGTTRPDPVAPRGSAGAYPEKGAATCGTCRRIAANLGIPLVASGDPVRHGLCLSCGDEWSEEGEIMVCPECHSTDVEQTA